MPKEELLNIKLVIFTVLDDKLKVYLTDFVLPYGKLESPESLDSAARRIFREESELKSGSVYFEQLCTISEVYNSKSQISIIYYFLIPEDEIKTDSFENWIKISNIKHNIAEREIIEYAVQRLRWKIEYTNVVYSLLPGEFTFGELQTVYEAILGESLDKRNFRKKILSLKLLKPTRHKKMIGRTRPAEMFSFRKRELTYVKILQPS